MAKTIHTSTATETATKAIHIYYAVEKHAALAPWTDRYQPTGFDMDYYERIDTAEIAETLLKLTNNSDNEYLGMDIERALHDIKLIAANKYNSEYWRAFIITLKELAQLF